MPCPRYTAIDMPSKQKPELEDLVRNLASPESSTSSEAARQLRLLSGRDAALLQPRRTKILQQAFRTQDLRTRWNLIQILSRLPLTPAQNGAATDWLFERLADQSPFTRTFALQALADLAVQDPALRSRVLPFAQRFAETGTPAMQARARKLLKALAG